MFLLGIVNVALSLLYELYCSIQKAKLNIKRKVKDLPEPRIFQIGIIKGILLKGMHTIP
jgi:hypothetical protein